MRDAHGTTRRRWLTEQQMRDAMEPPTIDEIFTAGEFARQEARRGDVVERWTELLLGFVVGLIVGLIL